MLIGVFLDLSKPEDKEMLEDLFSKVKDIARVQEIISSADGKIDMEEIVKKMNETDGTTDMPLADLPH